MEASDCPYSNSLGRTQPSDLVRPMEGHMLGGGFRLGKDWGALCGGTQKLEKRASRPGADVLVSARSPSL